MRRVIMALAVLGIWVSLRALQIHYSTESQPCSINDVWDCGIVNHSRYAVLSGVPVAAIGMAGYLWLAAMAALRKTRIVAVSALAGLAFALYLAYIEKYVLGVWCQFCVASLAIITLIAVLSVVQLVQSPRESAKPA
jgi:vitamin-K-epoxide reductase (warfarin-sensitive)